RRGRLRVTTDRGCGLPRKGATPCWSMSLGSRTASQTIVRSRSRFPRNERRVTRMARVKDRTGRLSAQETLRLWQQYKETGDARVRDRLVLTFAPMVKYIVYKKVREIPARCEVDDFISCGLEALIRSIDRYDPEKGATLEQFAWTRIHGAVVDELRRTDWAPRSLRRWERDITKAREKFTSLYGRAPSRSELS